MYSAVRIPLSPSPLAALLACASLAVTACTIDEEQTTDTAKATLSLADCPAPVSTCSDPDERLVVYDVDQRLGYCVNVKGAADATLGVQCALNRAGEVGAGSPGAPRTVGLGTVVQLPSNAELRVSDTVAGTEPPDGVALTVPQRIILEGRGAMLRPIERGDSCVEYAMLRVDTTASRSSVRDLRIRGCSGAPQPTGTGLEIRSGAVRLSNLIVSNFKTGIESVSNGAVRTNTNMQRWRDVRVAASAVGIRLQGGDANASLFSGLELSGCDVAIDDNSFLGNTYIAPMIEAADTASIQVGQPASYSTFVGAYIEGDSARAHYNSKKALVLGGNAVRWMDSASLAERVGLGHARLQFQAGNCGVVASDDECGPFVKIPGRPGLDSVIRWRHSRQEPNTNWDLLLRRDAGALRWRLRGHRTGGRPDMENLVYPLSWTAHEDYAAPFGSYHLGVPETP